MYCIHTCLFFFGIKKRLLGNTVEVHLVFHQEYTESGHQPHTHDIPFQVENSATNSRKDSLNPFCSFVRYIPTHTLYELDTILYWTSSGFLFVSDCLAFRRCETFEPNNYAEFLVSLDDRALSFPSGWDGTICWLLEGRCIL